ncbi:hypothetical protein AVEN_106024-1 [Araneus ventricosus]|uniref:Uncharacterized protein n=1 Tax=Araneus ventricosus TaxID=182803 RepID=A0A4Y2T794_ARAVE|nr:hypothetical protein AVEN_106024-1 [Araneus ventricosus]
MMTDNNVLESCGKGQTPPKYNITVNSGSNSDSSSTEFSNAKKSKKRSKNIHQHQKNRCLRNRKVEEVPFLSNLYQPIAPKYYEPHMGLSNEEEQYKENYPELPNLAIAMPPSAGDQQLNTGSIQNQLPPKPKRKYVPPIIIDDPKNTAQLIKYLNELTDSKVEG